MGVVLRFDVDEWSAAYPGEKLGDLAVVDILDLGYWTSAGIYTMPEADFRRSLASERF